MIKKILGKFSAIASIAFAFVAVSVAPSVHAVQSYDFASSSAESNALVQALAAQALIIYLAAIAALIGLALIMLGAGFVWGRFKKFSGLKKKL